MLRQGITNCTSAFFLTLIFGFITVIFSSPTFAESELSYGPIQSGQTLWKVAKETLPNNSISIEQQAYAIYNLNPGAFQSSNMNLLQIGAIITIPNTDAILKTSNTEAKKQLSRHVHALDIIRVEAKHLRTAKANTKKYKRHVKLLQKKLGKYRHRSRKWNSIYLKLVATKRNYARSKRKVVKLRGLLLEKATLIVNKPTQTIPKDSTKENMTEVNERLSQIQTSIKNLDQSNSTLIDKMQELTNLGERVKVLEQELGNNDDLVIQLKATLKAAQQAISEQSQTTTKLEKQFEQRFLKIEEKESKAENNSDTPLSKATTSIEIIPKKKEYDTELTHEESADAHTLKLEVPPINEVEALNTSIEDTSTNASVIESDLVNNIELPQNKTVEIESKNNEEDVVFTDKDEGFSKDEDFNDVYSTAFITAEIMLEEIPQNHQHSETIKTALKQPEVESISPTIFPEKATTMRAILSDKNTPTIKVSTVKTTTHQRKTKQKSSFYTSINYWKLIMIGSILNGIILIFVLFKLLFNKNTAESNNDNYNKNNYKSWQEREKPRLSSS